MDADFMHLEFLDRRIRKPVDGVDHNEASFKIGDEDANVGELRTSKKLFNLQNTQNESTFNIANVDAGFNPPKPSKKLFQLNLNGQPKFGINDTLGTQKSFETKSSEDLKSPFRLEKANAAKLSTAQKLVFSAPRRNFDFIKNKGEVKDALTEISNKLSQTKFEGNNFSFNNDRLSPLLGQESVYGNDQHYTGKKLKRTNSAPALNLIDQETPNLRSYKKATPEEIHKMAFHQSLVNAEQKMSIGQTDTPVTKVQQKLLYESQSVERVDWQKRNSALKNFHSSQVVLSSPDAFSSSQLVNSYKSETYEPNQTFKHPAGVPSRVQEPITLYGQEIKSRQNWSRPEEPNKFAAGVPTRLDEPPLISNFGTTHRQQSDTIHKFTPANNDENVDKYKIDSCPPSSNDSSEALKNMTKVFDNLMTCQCCASAMNRVHVPYNKVNHTNSSFVAFDISICSVFEEYFFKYHVIKNSTAF